jgi:hypothetical protein
MTGLISHINNVGISLRNESENLRMVCLLTGYIFPLIAKYILLIDGIKALGGMSPFMPLALQTTEANMFSRWI